MNTFTHHKTLHWNNRDNRYFEDNILTEEPLSIRIQGNPYSVIMRTPGEEMAHAAGFCLAEGIVDSPEDITSIGFCDGSDTNVVTVTLEESRRKRVTEHLERRGFISQTSCGLCGKEIVEDLQQIIKPINSTIELDAQKAYECLESLSNHQPLRDQTFASHCAALYNSDYKLLAVSEDVGRHNALDKVIGKLFLEHKLHRVSFLILSSRISYELVQKAARARIPVILAISRPTSLAIALASQLNITLANLNKAFGLNIFCGEQRLINRT